jgi:hypothetical protein
MNEDAKVAFDGTAALDLRPTLVESAAPRVDEKPRNQESDFPFAVTVGDVYEGPLDLLLHLIRKQDIDIYDIPIGRITAQYLAYVEKLRELDVNVAAEFIYMAAVLIHIKSKMLLPRDPAAAREIQIRGANADAETAHRRSRVVKSGTERIQGRGRHGAGDRGRRH